MRKITSRHESDRKAKRNQLIVGLVLLLIIFFSVIGYGFSGGGRDDSSNKVVYNGYEFIEQNGYWELNIGDAVFFFRYNPEQIERNPSFVYSINNYYQKPLYISSENAEAESEIYTNLNQFVERMQPACLEGKECTDENLAVKTCDDNFILIEESNNTNIIQNESCVFIQGPEERLTEITDGFLFKVLGIEKDF